MDEKICSKCKSVKDISEYGNNKRSKDGKKSRCKVCSNIDKKNYRENNKEKIRESRKVYRENNKEKIAERKKVYRENNKEKIRESKKIYRENNKEKSKLYYKQNKEKIIEYGIKYETDRRKVDPIYKLRRNISSAIRKSFRKRNWTKTSKTQEILGCDIIFFTQYLNDNLYGFSIDDIGLDLDHIIPLSTATNEQELLELNHYTNYQLLPSTVLDVCLNLEIQLIPYTLHGLSLLIFSSFIIHFINYQKGSPAI